MFIYKLKIISSLMLIFLLSACTSSESEPPDLKQAIKASSSLLAGKNLSRSSFYVAYPDGTPSDYVKYYFSPMGTAEWPPYEGGGEFSDEEMKMARITPIPHGIRFFPHQVAQDEPGKQVVIKADDERSMVIFEGYLSPSAPQPAIVVEKKLIKVEPSELAEMTFRSNQEMGVGY